MSKCSNCGNDNPPTAAYCLNCGATLRPAAPAAPAYQQAAASPPLPKRGGLPIVWLAVGLVALAAVAAVVVLLLNQNNSRTVVLSGERAPAVILADADAALNSVNTMRYNMTASFSNLPGAGDKPSQITLSGEIVRPDRYTMRGADIGEALVIGADRWQRRAPGNNWVKQAGGSGLGGLIDPNALADSSKYYTNALRLSDADVNGVTCYRIKFDVDAAKLKAAASGLDLGNATIAAEVWIGKADNLQRQMQLMIKLPSSGGEISGTVLIKLSGFNDPTINIAPPGLLQI